MDTDVYPRSVDQIESWDFEADVVIAGYGIAGAAAAVEAASAGADVLVLERTGGWGGAAAMAGGFIYLGGGTGLQQACGFDDSVDNMAAFLNVAMGPGADANRIGDYCAGSVDHFDWLVRCGVPFKPVFWGEPGWEPPGDEGLMFTGGENAFPFNTIAKPAPRGHIPQMSNKKAGEASAGYMLMKPLVDTATVAGCAGGVRRPCVVVDRGSPTAVSPDWSPVSTGSPWRSARDAALSSPRAASRTTTRCSRSTRPGSSGVRPHRSNSMTDKRSGWPRRSAPTWPTWMPPRWRS